MAHVADALGTDGSWQSGLPSHAGHRHGPPVEVLKRGHESINRAATGGERICIPERLPSNVVYTSADGDSDCWRRWRPIGPAWGGSCRDGRVASDLVMMCSAPSFWLAWHSLHAMKQHISGHQSVCARPVVGLAVSPTTHATPSSVVADSQCLGALLIGSALAHRSLRLMTPSTRSLWACLTSLKSWSWQTRFQRSPSLSGLPALRLQHQNRPVHKECGAPFNAFARHMPFHWSNSRRERVRQRSKLQSMSWFRRISLLVARTAVRVALQLGRQTMQVCEH